MRGAFDEVRFGRARTLDLHMARPSALQAADRTEAWLRERQASVGGEVLIITGRGRGSEAGIAVVRPAVERRLARLRRQGVVSEVGEHSPGSFVVTLAPLREMLAASRRKKDPAVKIKANIPALGDLEPATHAALQLLANYSLDEISAPHTDSLVADEMARQFTRLASSVGDGPDRERRLRDAIATALKEIDDLSR